MIFLTMLLSIIHLLVITSFVPAGAQIDAECFTNYLGRDYRGNVSTTITGKTCQKWTSQSPHEHERTPSDYPDAGLGDHNYCRNPIGWKGGVYCFTMDSSVRFEACDIGNWQITCDRADRCQVHDTPFKNSCYKLHTETTTRTEAKHICEPQGHLADITSSEENDFVNRLLDRSGTNNAWFGLLKTDVLIWSDETPLVSMGWHNSVKDRGHTCFHLDKDDDGYMWNDESCDREYPFMCESEAEELCPDGWSAHQSSCYLLSQSQSTWFVANDLCENAILQGHLVHITSADEQQFVEKQLSEYSIERAWFGLRKSFVWSDGSLLDVQPWQDIRADEESICFRIRRDVWYDRSCDKKYGFLCETEANELPSTNTDSSITERTDRDTGSIAGGVVGAFVVIALISFIVFIIYRRKYRETTSPSPKLDFDGPYDTTLQGTNAPPIITIPGSNGGTSHPNRTNQTYEPESAIGGKDTNDIYYDVKDQSEEYAYAYAEGQNNNLQQNSADQTYTYADLGNGSSPPAPSAEPAEMSQDEGWKKNSIYATSEDMNGLSTGNDGATKQGEGWVDNSIYGD